MVGEWGLDHYTGPSAAYWMAQTDSTAIHVADITI